MNLRHWRILVARSVASSIVPRAEKILFLVSELLTAGAFFAYGELS
jgi:hypothetical protein